MGLFTGLCESGMLHWHSKHHRPSVCQKQQFASYKEFKQTSPLKWVRQMVPIMLGCGVGSKWKLESAVSKLRGFMITPQKVLCFEIWKTLMSIPIGERPSTVSRP